MLTDLTHMPVNWIDGMKITKKHFEESEQYLHEQVRDVNAQQLTDFSFGILPAERSLDLTVFCDYSQQINVELNACKAVTPNGIRVHITQTSAVKINTNFKEIAARFGLLTTQTQNLYITLNINPFNRVPTGEPLMNENPPRHPYTQPEIKLDIIPAEYINTGQLTGSLVIGKISYQNGELLFQREFIPSCTAVNSMPIVLDWHNRFRQLSESWEQHCLKIIQKINAKSQQANSLTGSIQKLSEKVLEQLVSQKIYYQWIIQKSAPVFMCELLLRHIQHLYNTIICMAEKEREEMLNYFAEWADVQTGMIDNQTVKALQIQYNHYDINQVLSDIHQVYNLYLQIFQRLAQLEFIGKRKGQNIFVIEQEVKEAKAPPPTPKQEKTTSRWSPLT